jgi:hypothetical protein
LVCPTAYVIHIGTECRRGVKGPATRHVCACLACCLRVYRAAPFIGQKNEVLALLLRSVRVKGCVLPCTSLLSTCSHSLIIIIIPSSSSSSCLACRVTRQGDSGGPRSCWPGELGCRTARAQDRRQDQQAQRCVPSLDYPARTRRIHSPLFLSAQKVLACPWCDALHRMRARGHVCATSRPAACRSQMRTRLTPSVLAYKHACLE